MKNLTNLSLKFNVDISKVGIILNEIDSGVQKIQAELDRISSLFEDLSKADIPMNVQTPETLNTNDEYIRIDGADYKVMEEQEYETCKGCAFQFDSINCSRASNLVACAEQKVIFVRAEDIKPFKGDTEEVKAKKTIVISAGEFEVVHDPILGCSDCVFCFDNGNCLEANKYIDCKKEEVIFKEIQA